MYLNLWLSHLYTHWSSRMSLSIAFALPVVSFHYDCIRRPLKCFFITVSPSDPAEVTRAGLSLSTWDELHCHCGGYKLALLLRKRITVTLTAVGVRPSEGKSWFLPCMACLNTLTRTHRDTHTSSGSVNCFVSGWPLHWWWLLLTEPVYLCYWHFTLTYGLWRVTSLGLIEHKYHSVHVDMPSTVTKTPDKQIILREENEKKKKKDRKLTSLYTGQLSTDSAEHLANGDNSENKKCNCDSVLKKHWVSLGGLQ